MCVSCYPTVIFIDDCNTHSSIVRIGIVDIFAWPFHLTRNEVIGILPVWQRQAFYLVKGSGVMSPWHLVFYEILIMDMQRWNHSFLWLTVGAVTWNRKPLVLVLTTWHFLKRRGVRRLKGINSPMYPPNSPVKVASTTTSRLLFLPTEKWRYGVFQTAACSNSCGWHPPSSSPLSSASLRFLSLVSPLRQTSLGQLLRAMPAPHLFHPARSQRSSKKSNV